MSHEAAFNNNIRHNGSNISLLWLETHNHKGTTFHGTQISTLPLTEESAIHPQSHPYSGHGCLLANTR
jgi:hypothetical protein